MSKLKGIGRQSQYGRKELQKKKKKKNPLIEPSKVNTGQMSEGLILALIKSQTSLIFVSLNHEQLPGTL
jgi:hypothetical protein